MLYRIIRNYNIYPITYQNLLGFYKPIKYKFDNLNNFRRGGNSLYSMELSPYDRVWSSTFFLNNIPTEIDKINILLYVVNI